MNHNTKIENITITTADNNQLTKILNIFAYMESCIKNKYNTTVKINIFSENADIKLKFDDERWQDAYNKILELWDCNIQSRGNCKIDSHFDIGNQ